MDPAEFVQENLIELQNNTVCDENLLEALRQADILSDWEVSYLNSVKGRIGKSSRLWRFMGGKSIHFSTLCKIFEDLNQTGIVSILSKISPVNKDYTFLEDLKTFPVSVIRPSKEISYDDDTYKLDPFFIGLALIINVTVYDESSRNRNGVEQDTVYMSELWKQLGYRIIQHEGRYTKDEFIHIIESFCETFRRARHFQSCVIFIGCHGCFGKLVLSDMKELNFYDEFVRKFETRHLKGKPKIFIIQSCSQVRGGQAELKKFNIKDTIICFSSFGNFRLGSYFVYAFTDVVMREAHQLNFEEILNKVSQTLYRVLEPQDVNESHTHFLSLGMKPLYFNVKPDLVKQMPVFALER